MSPASISEGERWIRQRQAEWAAKSGLTLRDPKYLYCACPEQNMPWLTASIRSDLIEGDGNEFRERNGRAKICALYSSSALAVNMFGYCVRQPSVGLSHAVGDTTPAREIRFERKFSTGVGSRSPNVDVEVTCEDRSSSAMAKGSGSGRDCPEYRLRPRLRETGIYFTPSMPRSY